MIQWKKFVMPLQKDERAMPFMNFKIVNAKTSILNKKTLAQKFDISIH